MSRYPRHPRQQPRQQPRQTAWLLVLAFVSGQVPGCLISPDPGLWQNRNRDAATDSDGARIDLPGDGPRDGLPSADAIPDVKPDAPLPPKLTCKAPALAGKSQPGSMRETALRADGLDLVAQYSNNWYGAKRSDAGQPFGSWSLGTVLSGIGDPTFFYLKSVEHAIVARSHSGSARTLELCNVKASSCSKLTVKYSATGKEVTDDMDGPSVATATNKGVLMVHNIGPLGSGDGDVYLAAAVDSTDLSKGFNTTKVTTMAKAGYKEDDPAISPDGLMILFGGLTTSNDYDIWYSARATTTDSFPPPQRLSSVNSTSSDSGPYLAEVTIKGQKVLELYFRSDRSGGARIYRAECSYSY